MWHYLKSGKPVGPFGPAEMKRLVSYGAVTRDTKVWKQGMVQWRDAQSTELRELFEHSSAPPLQRGGIAPPLTSPVTSLSGTARPVGGFKDPTNRTKWLKIFLYITLIASLVAVYSDYLELEFFDDFKQGVYTSQEEAIAAGEASDKRQAIVSIIWLGILIVTGILFLRWIYRANYNARQLGASGMRFTPGWSVGYYFIPIMNLWRRGFNHEAQRLVQLECR